MAIKQGEIFDAILELRPQANFEVHEDNRIVWNDDNQSQPTMSEIENQIPITKFNIVINKFREKRNSLLTKTDYLALSDSTLTDNMKTYRQQLRDLTTGLDTVEKIDAVVWPTKPGA
mgnify:CR=1 FL=1